jgi:hypothetical protein
MVVVVGVAAAVAVVASERPGCRVGLDAFAMWMGHRKVAGADNCTMKTRQAQVSAGTCPRGADRDGDGGWTEEKAVDVT